MSRGRFDIYVKGMEDIYISDNPTYTYFSSVYKNTPYTSYRTVEVSTPDNPSGFGKTFRINLESLKGDIINNVLFQFVFPYTPIPDFKLTRYVMFTMFDYIDLYIGGQLIERLTGDFMLHYLRLKSSEDDWTNILMNTRATEVKTPNQAENISQSYPLACTIPIPFYFYKKDYLGIPIGALRHQRVEIEVSLKPIYTLVNNSWLFGKATLDAIGYDITNISILSETTTLSDISLLNKKLTYVIRQTQLQKARIPITESLAANVAFTNSMTNYNSLKTFSDNQYGIAYSNFFTTYYTYRDLPDGLGWNKPACESFRNNCNEAAEKISSTQVRVGDTIGNTAITEYNIVSSQIKNLKLYSNLITSNLSIYRSNVLLAQAAGASNNITDLSNTATFFISNSIILTSYSNIASNSAIISSNIAKVNNAVVSEVNIPINFTNPVKELFIFIKNDPSLTENDYNHIYYDFKNRYRTFYDNNYDYTQYQHLESACLRFNNQVAFDHDYMYLQSYEPYKNYPTSSYVRDFILYFYKTNSADYYTIVDYPQYYMYSFSMYPQNSYPSGQVNFSRIRYKNLALRLYPSSHVRFARIYARSYNVLVVNDGVAGLMFTNKSDYDYTFDINTTIPD